MKEKIKTALRIRHTALDSEIEDVIATAQKEMIRAGVKEASALSEDDELICQAVKTYALMTYASKDDAERYEKSWLFQLDNLRKSDYTVEAGDSDV